MSMDKVQEKKIRDIIFYLQEKAFRCIINFGVNLCKKASLKNKSAKTKLSPKRPRISILEFRADFLCE